MKAPWTALLGIVVGCASPSAPPVAPPESTAPPEATAPQPLFVAPEVLAGAGPHAPPAQAVFAGDASGRALGRALDALPEHGVWLRDDGALLAGETIVDTEVVAPLARSADGRIAYARAADPPETDLWVWRPGSAPVQRTHDGRSDRPFFLPDGSLLWISSAGGGNAAWVHEGRVVSRWPAAQVPARPKKTRVEAGPDGAPRVVFDAGDAERAFDPRTGETPLWP